MTHSPALSSQQYLNLGGKTLFLRDVDVFLTGLCQDAHALDQSPERLRQAFFQLGAPSVPCREQTGSDRPMSSLLGLNVPRLWGGQQLAPSEYDQFKEMVARYSGALAFLQTQHQGAVSRLARCDNHALKEQYLAAAVQGRIGIGVGFSQLRRLGHPLVTATLVPGGYCIQGQVPWITGYGCFQHFMLGATLPDGRSLFGLLPLETTVQPGGGSINLSAPMELAAMMSTNTVQASLNQWFLSTDQVLEIKPADWIHQSDRRNTLNHSFFALGCARAGLDIVASAAAKPYASPQIQPTWAALDQQLTQCRQRIYQTQIQLKRQPSTIGPVRTESTGAESVLAEPVIDHPLMTEPINDTQVNKALQLRAEAIALAVRCAHAAVIVSRGAANSLDHPAQRIYREALAFSVFGQTTAVMDTSLAQLL